MSELPLKALLDDAGLNRQHVFALQALPDDLLQPLALQAHERQLILLGHGGRRLWQQVQQQLQQNPQSLPEDHPIDAHSVRTARRWLEAVAPGARYRLVYPKGQPGGLAEGRHVGLQRLGQLAGWHHASPFMVGVDAHWGSWFAYRVVIVADTELPSSEVSDMGHPCSICAAKPCITACPAGALESGRMDLAACHRHRLAPNSSCALACLARQACPVGAEHRYEDSQIRHSSAGSLAVIRLYTARS